MNLIPIDLENSHFAPFGKVLSQTDKKADTVNDAFHYWSGIAKLKMSDTVSTVEKHDRTPEILVALDNDAILCVAESSKEEKTVNPQSIRAFYIRKGDSLVMNAGTWHWAPVPVLKEESKFLVIFASGTEDSGTEIQELNEKVYISRQ
jgi:ureidoglycolate hydrolase